MKPGDSILLKYSYQDEPEGEYQTKLLKVDDVEEPLTIDTVIVYRTEMGQFGLKAGRALIMGEDDGTYKDLPLSETYKPLIGNRVQK